MLSQRLLWIIVSNPSEGVEAEHLSQTQFCVLKCTDLIIIVKGIKIVQGFKATSNTPMIVACSNVLLPFAVNINLRIFYCYRSKIFQLLFLVI